MFALNATLAASSTEARFKRGFSYVQTHQLLKRTRHVSLIPVVSSHDFLKNKIY